MLLLEELNCAIWTIATGVGVGVGGIRRMRKGKNCRRRKAGTDGVD